MSRIIRTFILIITIYGANIEVLSQISAGGIPPGFTNPDGDRHLHVYDLPAPDLQLLLKEDSESGKYASPERVGVLLPVYLNPSVAGSWMTLQDGSKQWRLIIRSEGAQKLGLYFSDFYLPENSRFYVYNRERSRLIGAFTMANNHKSRLFATEALTGDVVIVELITDPDQAENLQLTISEVLYGYKNDEKHLGQFGKSGACNVNVNCSEGQNWQDQKRGVMKIHTKIGTGVYRCSGSLINNTNYDYLPYVFTADHCARTNAGVYSSEEDLNQWLFFFNYESETCEKPPVEPTHVSMTGASHIASVKGGTVQMGSDFFLVLLNDEVPPVIRPFYNGWSRATTPSQSGFGIHHPSGDIKKISTYSNPLETANWNFYTPNMYWLVRWSETENGHGVTEGGSSGSPLFNSDGLIIGQLTGGQAACTNLNGPDYYGKFSVSWESVGSVPEKQLKPWLDPNNLGVETLRGAYNEFQVISEFSAEPALIQIGGTTRFFDSSIGDPDDWHWIFEGGEPSEYRGKSPGPITYKRLGRFDVTLIARNEQFTDTLVREKYIQVVPGIFPNPAKEKATLLLGYHEEKTLTVKIHDLIGKPYGSYDYDISNVYSVEIDLRNLHFGMYIISAHFGDGMITNRKLIVGGN